MDEIERAIKKQQGVDDLVESDFEHAAIEIMKSKHHHTDGSDPVISVAHNSEIEQRVLQEAQNRTQQEVFEAARMKEEQPVEEQVVQRRPKTVMASCNCGENLFGKFENSEKPSVGDFTIKTYDAKGGAVAEYSVSGGVESTQYLSGGQNPDRDYA